MKGDEGGVVPRSPREEFDWEFSEDRTSCCNRDTKIRE